MAFGDYFKGPEHKANAARLEANIQALRAKYDDLEAKASEIGLLDLLAVQNQIRDEEARLVGVQAEAAAMQSDLDAARAQLLAVQQQILGAEDTVLLESFALYEPKYQFTNSIDYKARLDQIREEEKQSTRKMSAEIDAWDNSAVELTKSQWTKLRKDLAKLARRS